MKNLIAYCGSDCEKCGDCSAMGECQTVGMIVSNNAEALENLKKK